MQGKWDQLDSRRKGAAVARKLVKVDVCDRCPSGREKRATSTEFLSLGQTTVKLHLCDKHGRDLDRDFWLWGQLGETLEKQSAGKYNSDYVADARRAAELRAQQVEKERAEQAIESVPAAEAVSRAQMVTLPYWASSWVFTKHAMERLHERDITAVQALSAACTPSVTRMGRTDDTAIHENEHAKVVVNKKTKEILTVGYPQEQHRKAN